MENRNVYQPFGYLFVKTALKLERYKFLVSNSSGSAMFYDAPAADTGEFSGIAIVNRIPDEMIDISHQFGRSRLYLVLDSEHILRKKGALEGTLSINNGETAILFNRDSILDFDMETGNDVRWWCSVQPHTFTHAISDCLRDKLANPPYGSVEELYNMCRLESLLINGVSTFSAGMLYTSLTKTLGEYADQIVGQLDPERFRKEQLRKLKIQESTLEWIKEEALRYQRKQDDLNAAFNKFNAR